MSSALEHLGRFAAPRPEIELAEQGLVPHFGRPGGVLPRPADQRQQQRDGIERKEMPEPVGGKQQPEQYRQQEPRRRNGTGRDHEAVERHTVVNRSLHAELKLPPHIRDDVVVARGGTAKVQTPVSQQGKVQRLDETAEMEWRVNRRAVEEEAP